MDFLQSINQMPNISFRCRYLSRLPLGRHYSFTLSEVALLKTRFFASRTATSEKCNCPNEESGTQYASCILLRGAVLNATLQLQQPDHLPRIVVAYLSKINAGFQFTAKITLHVTRVELAQRFASDVKDPDRSAAVMKTS